MDGLSLGTRVGRCADGVADAGDMPDIFIAIDAVDLATKKSARLSRRTSRALRAASAAAVAAADVCAFAVVLSDHVGANPPFAADRAQSTRDHAAAVRIQAGATVKSVRAVNSIDACVERRHTALEGGNHRHAALYEDI